MTKQTDKIISPSVLAFERKLEISDGLMFSGNFKNTQDSNTENWKSITIEKRYNRSTQSAHGTGDYNKTLPNPVSSGNDDANLFFNNDTLKLSFSLRVLGNIGTPSTCNNQDFERAIFDKVSAVNSDVISTVAFRYAYNIANGRFLWRNRLGAEKVCINVQGYSNDLVETMTFNGYDFSTKNFEKNKDNADLLKLAKLIDDGFLATGDDKFTRIEVQAFVKLGDGQHVFPSEEMNMGEKGKVLFNIHNNAAMHGVKIGNAIRTIDSWYGDKISVATSGSKTSEVSVYDKTPIPIDPFGAVTQRGCAYRSTKIDLYTLMNKWVNEDDLSDNGLTDDDKCYIVASLIRGGVYSFSSK